MRLFAFLILSLFLGSLPAVAATECEDYLAEAEAVSGVAPRFNLDGSFRSLMSYATSDFLAPKQSLINAARTIAEMQAKQSIAAWMEERFTADSSAKTEQTQTETTNADGSTVGVVQELTALAETYRANSDAVLKGVVKLDECIAIDSRVIYVALGWKPDAPKTTGKKNAQERAASIETSVPAVSSRIITLHIDVDGIGPDQTIAINDGLRLAVSQVYGEQFAASVGAASLAASSEATNMSGKTSSASLVGQSVSTATFSTTSGVISGYRIIEVLREGENIRVRLSVDIPRYQPSELGNAPKLIVLSPRRLPGASPELIPHLTSMQRETETLLTQSQGLNILNRENIPSLDAELVAMANGRTYHINEIAKLGNRLGTDLVLITEIGRFDIDREIREIGALTVETFALRGEVWAKVVDVVTSATVFAIRIPVDKFGMATSFDLGSEAIRVAEAVALAVGEAIGSGFPPSIKTLSDASTVQPNTASQSDVKPTIDAVKKEISNEW